MLVCLMSVSQPSIKVLLGISRIMSVCLYMLCNTLVLDPPSWRIKIYTCTFKAAFTLLA